MKFSKAPDSQFWLSPYLLVNLALILCYPYLRIFTEVGTRDLRHLDSFGFTFENSIIYTGLAFVVIYYNRSASLRGFFLDCLGIGKIVVACLLIFAQFRLSLYYMALCGGTWLILPYPKFNAPNKFIKITSVDHFDQLVGDVKIDEKPPEEDFDRHTYQYRDKKMFFVEFYADWLYPCHTSKQLWYEYSNRYSTPSLKFLQVNVTKLPQLAQLFSINTSGFTKQLPTVLMIEDGYITSRFPPIKEEGKVDRVVKLDYKILLRYFDLENRYLETRPSRTAKKQA